MTENGTGHGAHEDDNNVVLIRNRQSPVGVLSKHTEKEVYEGLMQAISRAAQSQTGPDMRDIDLYADDLKSIESEAFFGQRFGFVLGRRGREAVINIMDEYDFTSAEIKALYMVGSMRWDGRRLSFKNVIWLKLLGAFQILLLVPFLALFMAIILANDDAAWHIRLSLVIVLTALIYAVHWVHRTFIAPFRALRRRVERDNGTESRFD